MTSLQLTYFLMSLIVFTSFISYAEDNIDCDSDTVYSLPLGSACESDYTSCLTDLVCYIAQEDLVNDDSFVHIEGGEQHFNQLFWHGRYIETRISQDNYEAFSHLQDTTNEMTPLTEDTLIIKHSISSSDDDITILDSSIGMFIMYKPVDGYCPDDNQLSDGECPTGNWMWVSAYTYDTESGEYSSPPAITTGKPSKCVSCHSTVSRTDSVFNLFISRKYGSVAE